MFRKILVPSLPGPNSPIRKLDPEDEGTVRYFETSGTAGPKGQRRSSSELNTWQRSLGNIRRDRVSLCYTDRSVNAV